MLPHSSWHKSRGIELDGNDHLSPEGAGPVTLGAPCRGGEAGRGPHPTSGWASLPLPGRREGSGARTCGHTCDVTTSSSSFRLLLFLGRNGARMQGGTPQLERGQGGLARHSNHQTVSLKLRQALTFPRAVSISTKNVAFHRGKDFCFQL